MKNNVSKILIGIALVFTAGAAYSEPVEYTFSTGDPIFIDPLLTWLTSVSGSFIYENAGAPFLTDPEGGTHYRALSALSGSADGNSFDHSVGSVLVGNDTFSLGGQNPGLSDFFLLDPGPILSGFTFAEMPLVHVFLFWIEGQNGIGDFIQEDQSLPSVLPPTIAGELELDFLDPVGVVHRAFFHLTVVAGQPVDTPKINFHGPLEIVEDDSGGAIYSGVPIGTEFFIEFDLVSAFSTISDGTTATPFSAFFANGSIFQVTNDFFVNADDAAYVNSFAGTSFVAGDLVDLIELEGETLTSGGGRIEIGVSIVLDPLAFDDESPNNFPPDPDDILTIIFFIDEEDDQGVDIYSAAGVVDLDLPAEKKAPIAIFIILGQDEE